jgi:hypothetical protein
MVNQYKIDVLLDATTVSKLLIMIRLFGRTKTFELMNRD